MVERPEQPPGIRTPQHGTVSEYTNHGCRCELCRAAMNKRQKALYLTVGIPRSLVPRINYAARALSVSRRGFVLDALRDALARFEKTHKGE